jgi:hypothetical protein
MTVIILFIIVGVVVYVKGTSEPAALKELLKGKNSQQQDVIKYFWGKGGFLTKRISDNEYKSIVNRFVDSSDFKQKALDKIGLDESQVSEIEPVHFEDWSFGKSVSFIKKINNSEYLSSAYQITWMFFSSDQIYIYTNTVHFDKDDKKVLTEEYFYKDVTNFSTTTDTEEMSYYENGQKKITSVDSNRFKVIVPGAQFVCSLNQNEYTERAIQGMKAKLREKKS